MNDEHVWISTGRLILETQSKLERSQAAQLRGYIASKFPQYDLLHNHRPKSGEEIYRYPLIQYKVLHGLPMITAFGDEAISLLEFISENLGNLRLPMGEIKVKRKFFDVRKSRFGLCDHIRHYMFATPCLLLNSKNYREYRKNDGLERELLLQRLLINNILRVAKGVGYTVNERIVAEIWPKEQEISFKEKIMLGFSGLFATNFYLPALIGIGKSCSRSLGCCVDIT